MNQRQKKRVSQGKKRYHEAARRQDAHGKAPTQPQKRAESKSSEPLEEGSPKKQDNDVPPVKSYSRRKIASNWSRYDEGKGDMLEMRSDSMLRTSETEEELQQRLLQLFNLPNHPHTTVTAETAYSQPETKQISPYISLDCNSLATALAVLPVHERLGLCAETLEMGGYSVSSDVEEIPSLVSKTSTRMVEQRQPEIARSSSKESTHMRTETTQPKESATTSIPDTTKQTTQSSHAASTTVLENVTGSDNQDLQLFQQATIKEEPNIRVKEIPDEQAGTMKADELDGILDELLS